MLLVYKLVFVFSPCLETPRRRNFGFFINTRRGTGLQKQVQESVKKATLRFKTLEPKNLPTEHEPIFNTFTSLFFFPVSYSRCKERKRVKKKPFSIVIDVGNYAIPLHTSLTEDTMHFGWTAALWGRRARR